MHNSDCVFCRIVAGELPAHKIWEDAQHLAFLSIFPNTPGFSVVITKEHHPSYLFELPESTYLQLMLAARKVGLLLDQAFDTVGRTGCFMEGFGINHAHVKLSPMHGTTGEWRPIKSNVSKYFETYEGYLSSHDHARADDALLAEIAQTIRKLDTPGVL